MSSEPSSAQSSAQSSFTHDELEFIFFYFRESLRHAYTGRKGVVNVEDQPDSDFRNDIDPSILDRARRVVVKSKSMINELINAEPQFFWMKKEEDETERSREELTEEENKDE